jgi:ABC-type ATPase with predicted acetyltransferase domain
MALAAGKRYIFADEFCSQLDRISASVISHNIRKFAKQRRATFILAGAHDDILADLQPDILVVKNLAANAQVIYKDIKQADE